MTTLGPIKGFPCTFLIWYHEERSNRDHGRAVTTETAKQDEHQNSLTSCAKGRAECYRVSCRREWLGWWVALQKGTAAIATAREEEKEQRNSLKNKGAYKS